MEIIIIGAGAMGCLFGAILSSVSRVTLLERWEVQVSAIQEKGLVLEGLGGKSETFDLPIVSDAKDLKTRADLAIVFTKSHMTFRAAEDAATVLKDTGLALTLQNGIGNVETLEGQVGPGRALAGVTSHGATLLGPGQVRHAGEGPTILARPKTGAERIEGVAAVFRRAGLETHLEENVERLIWGKLVVNAGINALAAILKVRNGVIGSEKACETVMAKAVSEAVAVAGRLGIGLPYDAPVEQVRKVCEKTAGNRASMLQDILRGTPTEIESINGAIARKGLEVGIETPCNLLLAEIIRAMEATAKDRIQEG